MFKGLGNLANLGSVLKQAQQMDSTLQGVSERLRTKRVTGVGGGGLVEVEANGLGEVLSVAIDPSLVEKGDREMIETCSRRPSTRRRSRSNNCTPKRSGWPLRRWACPL